MMSKQATFNTNASQVVQATMAAPRQAWLAGLGAASVARDWARNEASETFRSLVRQGSSIERRAIDVVGTRAGSSLVTAAAVLRQARDSVVRTTCVIVETATMLVPNLTRSSRVANAAAHKPTAVKSKRSAKARTTRPVRPLKRATKKARLVS
jgi:poly(hydroxyalkanoate) granule associated protein phasin